MQKYTPMMEQYLKIKEQYKYTLLFYRLGDFYELFFDDAIIASRELEITLTGKDCGQKERAPMCGVPFHSAEGYIARLVEKGYKVAICEQTEDAKYAKGLVKRDVVRVVTPGTMLDTNVLDERKNNFIMCIYIDKGGYGISVCDVSTGEFLVTEFNSDENSKIIDEIAKYNPAEIIVNKESEISDRIYDIFNIKVSIYVEWAFNYQSANIKLCNHFKVLNLSGFGLENDVKAVCAAGAVLEYLYETQKNALSHILSVKKYSSNGFMIMDISSRKNLELTETIRDKSKKGSLLWVIDKTKTSMGGRLLRKWIEQPLLDIADITKRLDCVEQFKEHMFEREELKEYLNKIYDIERIMGKIVFATANAKDLIALKNSFETLPCIKSLLPSFKCSYIDEICLNFDILEDLYSLIDSAVSDEPPFSVREGGLIKEGYNEEVDKLKNAKKEGSSWLLQLENKEKELTGIKNLKIKFNKIFGYYIEITNSFLSMAPDRYIRKQTLANCERFITPELKEIEETILGADEKAVELEYSLFCDVRNKISNQVERIKNTAYNVALLDVFQSLGESADKFGYVKPVVNNSGQINIIDGRHPVVEQTIKEGFVPNDIVLNTEQDRLSIITGPNMAGKSTYMRQVALLVLMAQIGSFVPAQKAEIGVCDRIFTRVGASDDLATGQSTFMIEMSEVANILNNATKNSLLILDEIGRGTSTFDGLSIAWAVLEYIASKENIGARTLFATHYHELTRLEGKVEGVKNYSVAVKEDGDNVVFLRKIVPGGTDKSYGIHVAKIAGVPEKVLNRSIEILEILTSNESGEKEENSIESLVTESGEKEGYYTAKKAKRNVIIIQELGEDLKELDVDNLSPIEALSKLYSLKEKVKLL